MTVPFALHLLSPPSRTSHSPLMRCDAFETLSVVAVVLPGSRTYTRRAYIRLCMLLGHAVHRSALVRRTIVAFRLTSHVIDADVSDCLSRVRAAWSPMFASSYSNPCELLHVLGVTFCFAIHQSAGSCPAMSTSARRLQ